MRIWWWWRWSWWWLYWQWADHLVWYDKNGGKGGDGNGEKKKQFPTQRRRVRTQFRFFCARSFSIFVIWSTTMTGKVALFRAWLWGCRTWRLVWWRPSWTWRFGRSWFCIILCFQVGDEEGEVATSFLFCNLEKKKSQIMMCQVCSHQFISSSTFI